MVHPCAEVDRQVQIRAHTGATAAGERKSYSTNAPAGCDEPNHEGASMAMNIFGRRACWPTRTMQEGRVIDVGTTTPGKRRPRGIEKAFALGPILKYPIEETVNRTPPGVGVYPPHQPVATTTVCAKECKEGKSPEGHIQGRRRRT